MVPEVITAWKTATTVAKGLSTALKTIKDVETKQAISAILDDVLDLQAKLFSAQAEYEALSEVKRKAEEKLVAYEKWDTDASRYALKEIVTGIFVYALKADHAAGEPIHWLCPNCFTQRHKSILTKFGVDYLNYQCHHCKFQMVPTSQHFPRSDYGEATYSEEY